MNYYTGTHTSQNERWDKGYDQTFGEKDIFKNLADEEDLDELESALARINNTD